MSTQLPGGRHGLSPDAVASNQHERILNAVAEVCSTVGYAAMSVEAIIATAGVSRRTFYDMFTNREEAFLAAYGSVSSMLLEQLNAAFDSREDGLERIRACLIAMLDFFADEPAFADLCVVEVLAAGPEALQRRTETMASLIDGLQRGVRLESRPICDTPALTAEAVVGGIHEVIYTRILQGRTADLPKLLPDLIFSILVPYTGHDVASAARDAEHERLAAAPDPS